MKKGLLFVLGALMLLTLEGCSSDYEAPYVNSEGYWVVDGSVTDVNVNDSQYTITVTVKSVEKTSSDGNVDTYTITFSDGSTFTYTVTNGIDGSSPAITIGENGNWYINGVDSGVSAVGSTGRDGSDGETPYIGENGNWWIGDTDTGVAASGKDGKDGSDGQNAPHYGETFTVTFDANGGNLPDGTESEVEVGWGDCVDLPTPTYAGHTFTGWYTGTTANDSKFSSKDAVFKDLNLIALYDTIYYTLPAGVEPVSSSDAKDGYLYGETIKIKAIDSDEKDFDYFVSYTGSRNYQTEIDYTFGSEKNYKEIVYRDHATSTDGFEGTYTGTITIDGEEESLTLVYDGYGYYVLNDESKTSLYAYENNVYTAYSTGFNENLFIEALKYPAVTLELGSFHLNETLGDGNSYTYFEATETNYYSSGKTIRLWKDGNAYEEKADFKYKGSIVGTCTKGDYEGSVLEFIFGSDGNGTLYVDDVSETTVTYASEETDDDGNVTYTFSDKYGDEITLTASSDGTFSVTYGDYKTFSATYSYPWYGTFTGTDSEETEVKIMFDETGVGTLYLDGSLSDVSFYIESYTPDEITVYNETEDTTYTLSVTSDTTVSGRVSTDFKKTTLTFVTSYKSSCAIAGTYTYSDDEGDYKVIIDKDWSGAYYEDDMLILKFTLEINDDGTYTATDADDGTYKITVTESGIKARFGDSAVSYTKAS